MNDLEKRVHLFARISLVCIFLVIIAGSIVRMTGSGMGCPDWPTCFGYLIPPTDVSELTYSQGRTYNANQMVIQNDTLWVANHDLVAEASFARDQWHKYPKHDYAEFNAVQTWIEYINRLLTAVLALPSFLLLFFSVRYSFRYKTFTPALLAGGLIFSIGFVAWLGKLVVDGNLAHGKVTFHMIGSMMIISFMTALVSWSDRSLRAPMAPKMRWLAVAVLLLGIAQVLMGTQVREGVDEVALRNDQRHEWIGMLPVTFIIHRSFSLLVVGSIFWLYRLNEKLLAPFKWIRVLLVVIVLEIVAGVVLAYAGMPRGFQPVHLFFAMVMFALAFYGLVNFSRKKSAEVPTR
ncbi:MAG: COX15/CtaA family protein [Nitrospirota bacterium]|nr:COX15/CtaA family protein [Nitrospirota bacterium]